MITLALLTVLNEAALWRLYDAVETFKRHKDDEISATKRSTWYETHMYGAVPSLVG